MSFKLNTKYLERFISSDELKSMELLIKKADKLLNTKQDTKNDFTGWLNLPNNYDIFEFERISLAAEKIKNMCDILIVIGIGGSYTGPRACIEALKSNFYNQLEKNTPDILFVGNNLSSDYISDIIEMCRGKDLCINVISKSGTTTEPAVAFRIFREIMDNKYGKDSNKRIFCTTDKSKGTLKILADIEKYETFVIPDNIGGRFSFLTAVGLLPIAVAGIDIHKIMEGAQTALKNSSIDNLNNDCYKYAAIRNILYNKGRSVEIFVSYQQKLSMFLEWSKQLFGESEGKDKKGIYPTSAIFSTDLHSLGQFMQDGNEILFETVLNIKSPNNDITIKKIENDFDSLNYLSSKTVSEINEKAMISTAIAHTDGNLPNIIFDIDKMDEETFGYMIYFFEKACAISAYILGVNPFDQPGVEEYKNNMFALLEKPGYEDLLDNLKQQI